MLFLVGFGPRDRVHDRGQVAEDVSSTHDIHFAHSFAMIAMLCGNRKVERLSQCPGIECFPDKIISRRERIFTGLESVRETVRELVCPRTPGADDSRTFDG
ncbi:hypothetical protein GCM10025331_69980 [Actinoplanes utahensis]|nr:hypothetical protein Aut01nite_75650 [Actinoplanes utahensis]